MFSVLLTFYYAYYFSMMREFALQWRKFDKHELLFGMFESKRGNINISL